MNDLPTLRRMLIRKMVVDMAIPEKTIEHVIAHSFDGVVKALAKHSSVEISGFGKFELREGIVKKEIRKQKEMIAWFEKEMEDPLMTEVMKERRIQWIERCNVCLGYIKTRGYGN